MPGKYSLKKVTTSPPRAVLEKVAILSVLQVDTLQSTAARLFEEKEKIPPLIGLSEALARYCDSKGVPQPFFRPAFRVVPLLCRLRTAPRGAA